VICTNNNNNNNNNNQFHICQFKFFGIDSCFIMAGENFISSAFLSIDIKGLGISKHYGNIIGIDEL
jgi:hypothetical protein